MKTQRTVAPTHRPVTYEEAKEHLKLLDDSEKQYVENLVAVATSMAEEYCNRSLMTQTLVMYQDVIPESTELFLPYAPLQSVTSIKYKDTDGDEQTFSSAQYTVDTVAEPGRVVLVPNSTGWPSTQSGGINTFYVTFIAGYTSADLVPIGIKQAILLWVHHWYSHREDVSTISPMMGQSDFKQMPKAASFLLFPHRVPTFGG